MNKFEWVAEGPIVYLLDGDRKSVFCTMSKELLTPKSAAEETARALNRALE